MGGFDNATWQALGLVLTLLGLAASALVWARKGPASGLRAAAWSLLPLAAGLTGTLRLGWDIADAVGRWAGRLVFSPAVWLGILVALTSAVLFVVSGWMLRRSRTATAGSASGSKAKPLPRKASAAPVDEDLADIEAILRKHGIS